MVLVPFHLCIPHTYVIGSPTILRAKPFLSSRIPFEAEVSHLDSEILSLKVARYF
jgi:hypothetical protein